MDRENLRPLVIHTEGIRHPFRQSLPIEIVQIAREKYILEAAATNRGGKWLGEDASLFLLSFLAFFTAFYMFII